MLRRGVELRRQGDDAAALAAFTAAYAALPDARAAAQLATTHQALGHWVEADRLLGEALAAASDPWIVRGTRAALAAAAAEIARHLGTLDVVGETVGAEALLDGRVVGRLPARGPASHQRRRGHRHPPRVGAQQRRAARGGRARRASA